MDDFRYTHRVLVCDVAFTAAYSSMIKASAMYQSKRIAMNLAFNVDVPLHPFVYTSTLKENELMETHHEKRSLLLCRLKKEKTYSFIYFDQAS